MQSMRIGIVPTWWRDNATQARIAQALRVAERVATERGAAIVRHGLLLGGVECLVAIEAPNAAALDLLAVSAEVEAAVEAVPADHEDIIADLMHENDRLIAAGRREAAEAQRRQDDSDAVYACYLSAFAAIVGGKAPEAASTLRLAAATAVAAEHAAMANRQAYGRNAVLARIEQLLAG